VGIINDVTATILPADAGWWVVHKREHDSEGWSKIIAWHITHDGFRLRAISAPNSEGNGGYDTPSEHCHFVYDLTRTKEGLESGGSWAW